MEIWYWEYWITYWTEVDMKQEDRSGVVSASTMAEAVEILNEFYGDDIMNIKALRALADTVLEFNRTYEVPDDVNFKIIKLDDF